jgi:hypothetical protein
MTKMSEKKKLLVIGGAAAGVCLLAAGGVWWASGLIEDARLEIEAKQKEIASAEEKIKKIPETEREVIILRENLDEYVKILPENKDLNAFVRKLNEFRTLSGVQSTASTPGKPSKGTKGADRFTKIEYAYELKATLWQFQKFINFIENYERFVSIASFTISPGGGRETELRDGEVVHGMKLMMETYTYNGKSAGQDVTIPDYDKKRDALREEIFKRMQSVHLDRYEHKGQNNRRDIFVDPRETVGEHGNGPTQAEQKAMLEQFIGSVQKLKELQQRLKNERISLFETYQIEKSLKEGVAQLRPEVDKVGTDGRMTHPAIRMRWAKEVVDPLENIEFALRQAGPQGDQYLSRADLEAAIAEMTKDLEMGNLEQAKERYESVEPKLGVPLDDPRRDLVVQAKMLHLKVTTALDFKKLDLRIQGVLVNGDGPSGILLNGEVYQEGEYVNDDLLVRNVREEEIYFVFRGLTLVRTL